MQQRASLRREPHYDRLRSVLLQRRDVHERLPITAPCSPEHADEDAIIFLDDRDAVAEVALDEQR
jgi:hypothetical protein